MTITDKLLELNNVKQDIKTAIEGKGVDMTGVPFTGYPAKIDSITTGTGMSYHDYAKMLYTMWGYETQFTEAWTESQNSLEVLFEIPLMLAAPNQSFAGQDLDLYVGTDSALTDLYNSVASGEFLAGSGIIINKAFQIYYGDISSDVGMPFPVYSFSFTPIPVSLEEISELYSFYPPSYVQHAVDGLSEQFVIADLTPLGMGLGIVLGKHAGAVTPDNHITIRRGFENYEAGLIIPEMIEVIRSSVFQDFNVVNSVTLQVPFIIGPNVKYIGSNAFSTDDYKLPVIIPDSVECIEWGAFNDYRNNSNYIVIPKNVTFIGPEAFRSYGSNYSLETIVVMYPEIPPYIDFYEPLPFPFAYDGGTITPIIQVYVPDDAVSAYISAWPVYADNIKPISSLPYYDGHAGNRGTAVELTQAQYDALSVYDDNTYYLIVEE